MSGLLGALGGNPTREAAVALFAENREIVVSTGFPVDGNPETDGPPGAIVLVDALRRLRKAVKLASWNTMIDILRALRPDYAYFEVLIGKNREVHNLGNIAHVTVEVCGETEDGTYRNMRDVDISAVTPHFEDVFGYNAIVSIGDGGNEFGMGSAPIEFFTETNVRRPKSTAQVLVPATTSNHGAYAIVRELELISGSRLLPVPDDHIALIGQLVQLGCVDGFSGQRIPAVDGRPISESKKILLQLKNIQR